MRAPIIGMVLLSGCGGAQREESTVREMTVREAATASVEPQDLPPARIAGVTIGQDGRATPFGASGGEPVFALDGPTVDPTYAYSPENPARVGGIGEENPESGQQGFLNALLGPQGQPIYYGRIGSCCPFEDGTGMLDAFAITYEGLGERQLVLYLDPYHREALYVPVGLTGIREPLDAAAVAD